MRHWILRNKASSDFSEIRNFLHMREGAGGAGLRGNFGSPGFLHIYQLNYFAPASACSSLDFHPSVTAITKGETIEKH